MFNKKPFVLSLGMLPDHQRTDKIILFPGTELTHGYDKLIFQHPHQSEQLIKVKRPDGPASSNPWAKYVYWMNPRYGRFFNWMCENEEIEATATRLGYIPRFFQAYYGQCDTSMGLGMIVEKISGENGELAKTLEACIEENLLPAAQLHVMVDDLVNQMLEASAFVSDLNISNIVVATKGASPRLVVGDGFGDRGFLQPRKRFKFKRIKDAEKRRANLHATIDELGSQ